MPDAQRWPLLERLAEGSVRRALQLAGSGGLELYERIEALLAALPQVDWPAVHTLADQLSLAANEQRFEAFFDLLLDLLARLVRARATGRAAAPELALARAADPRGEAAGLGGPVGGHPARAGRRGPPQPRQAGADPGHVRQAGGHRAALSAELLRARSLSVAFARNS